MPPHPFPFARTLIFTALGSYVAGSLDAAGVTSHLISGATKVQSDYNDLRSEINGLDNGTVKGTHNSEFVKIAATKLRRYEYGQAIRSKLKRWDEEMPPQVSPSQYPRIRLTLQSGKGAGVEDATWVSLLFLTRRIPRLTVNA